MATSPPPSSACARAPDFPGPYPAERLIATIGHAAEKRRLVLEKPPPRKRPSPRRRRGSHSSAIPRPCCGSSRRCGISPTPTWTCWWKAERHRKEVVASALHRLSRRRQHELVAINCALPESVIESELFGHEAGVSLRQGEGRIGRIEHASGGTLFLDEIESMPLNIQVKFPRAGNPPDHAAGHQRRAQTGPAGGRGRTAKTCARWRARISAKTCSIA